MLWVKIASLVDFEQGLKHPLGGHHVAKSLLAGEV